MRKPLGLVALVVGILLLVWGFNAADSPASEITEVIQGRPTDEAMWLIIGGAVATVARRRTCSRSC